MDGVMTRNFMLAASLFLLVACQAPMGAFDPPQYKERPTRQNANRLQDLSLGLQIDEVRKYMGIAPIHNSIDAKKPFKNPVMTYQGKDEQGQNLVIDVYVTYASALGDCPEKTYRTEPTVFINGVLVGIGWSYVKRHEKSLALNHLWIRRASEYEYLQECK